MNLLEFTTAANEALAKAGESVVQVDGRERGAASGIIWRAEGLVVTADHVVERSENISVTLADGSTHPAEVVGRDPSSDVALLRISATGLPVAAPLPSGELRIGMFVWAIARPEGALESTLGVISKLIPLRNQSGHLLRTDVLMYPGFSGGALVDASGRLAGLNSSAILRGASGALPVALLERIVNSLQEHGRVPRGFLGVSLQPVRLSPALAGKVAEVSAPQETALMVMSTEADGPAAAAGIQQGDLLLALDDAPTRTLEELQRALRDNRAGKGATLRIVRGGAIQSVPVEIGTR